MQQEKDGNGACGYVQTTPEHDYCYDKDWHDKTDCPKEQNLDERTFCYDTAGLASGEIPKELCTALRDPMDAFTPPVSLRDPMDVSRFVWLLLLANVIFFRG